MSIKPVQLKAVIDHCLTLWISLMIFSSLLWPSVERFVEEKLQIVVCVYKLAADSTRLAVG